MLSYLNPLPQLPKYRGPYKVGSCEYEIPVSEITSGSEATDSSISTIKFRVYYPTTTNAKSKTSIPWLPTPQKEGNRAYAKFLGLSEKSSGIVANLPSMLSYPTLPAVHNAPLIENSDKFPVAVFSHGLGGNYNTYSSFVGSLASCGVIVFAPEHRDQSAPVSFVRSSRQGPGRPVLYRRISHNPTVEVLNGRNEMLRTRLWELEKLFTVMSAFNEGKDFTNFADDTSVNMPSWTNTMDLSPSKVTWAGHSFGAATMVQFVKTVYYRQFAPAPKTTCEEGWDYAPLYTPADNSELVSQITAESPMVLLDLWTMPLTSKSTHWLWERPLPCYERQAESSNATPNVISIMSTQFYKWPEMVDRTKAMLSADPVQTYALLKKTASTKPEQSSEDAELKNSVPDGGIDPISKLETSKTSYMKEEELTDQDFMQLPLSLSEDNQSSESISDASTRTPSPARSEVSSLSNSDAMTSSSNSSVTSLPSSTAKSTVSGVVPQLYLVPTSAHLSQSDFGVLFPNVTKYLLKTIEPSKIMELNVRAATAMMRGCGIPVKNLDCTVGQNIKDGETDRILTSGFLDEAVWKRLEIAA